MSLLHPSLRARMTLAVTSLILVLMLVTGLVSLAFFEREYERNMTEQQSNIVRYLAGDVDAMLLNIQDALSINAQTVPDSALSAPHEAHNFLASRTGLRRYFKNHLHLYGSDGHLIGTLDQQHHDESESIANQPYFKKTIQQAKPVITDPTVHGHTKNTAFIIFTAPVIRKDGHVVGVLTGGFNLYDKNPLSRYVSLILGKSGILRLISSSQQVLIHERNDRILQGVSQGAGPIVEKALRDGTATGRHLGVNNQVLIASMQRLKSVNWILAASYPESEVYAQVRKARLWFIVATLIGMGISVVVVLIMMRLLTRPLAQLTSHVSSLPGKQGEDRFIHLPVNGEIGSLTGAFNSMVEEIDQNTKALRESEQRYRIVTEFTNDFTYWRRPDGTFEFISPACLAVTGYSREELAAKPALMEEMIHPADKYLLEELSTESCGNCGDQEIECRIFTKEGSARWVRHTCRPIYDDNLNFLGRRGCRSDISEQRQLADQVSHMVLHDLLTGLPNRSLFADRLFQVVANKERYSQEITVVLFFGIDRFKMINDTLGHETGDRLLIMVAERLKKLLHPDDTICRFGGDVFAFILPARESRHEAVTMSYRILASLTDPFNPSGQQVNLTGSIGIAICPQDGTDVQALLKNAETALYDAKRSGKNCFRFYASEMNALAVEILRLDNSMPHGLSNGDFYLHYQPQLDLKNDSVVAVEALLRWRHPELGMIPPDRFIPLAEESGFIIKLGEWVLRSACAQCAAWQKNGLAPLRIAVNVSGRQFNEPDFVDMVAAALNDSHLAPELLELELTESLLILNEKEALQKLQLLKKMGIYLAIDDFGTGYSSLAYLKHFPLDRLKIDKSFINDILTDPDDAAITEAIIAMAHSLKLKVIAEGVEMREQLLFLEDRGCDEMQGYYLSKPLSEHDLTSFIVAHKDESRRG
jgi:diguanylate cyclase (GGDEF)-like protein/PAS domain S-box-containing protein